MKTLLLTLIALTIGILPIMAGDPYIVEARFLPTLPPGWEIIKIEPVTTTNSGQYVEWFLVNPATGQTAVWYVSLGL